MNVRLLTSLQTQRGSGIFTLQAQPATLTQDNQCVNCSRSSFAGDSQHRIPAPESIIDFSAMLGVAKAPPRASMDQLDTHRWKIPSLLSAQPITG
jgi:hypothetical protein